MLEIFVVRHGQDEDNVAGILNGHRNKPLTDYGKQQASNIAEKIKGENLSFDAIFASPLTRALDTGRIIARELEAPEPEIAAGLIERDFGCMTGRPVGSVENCCFIDLFKTDKITYFLNGEKVETFDRLLARVSCLLQWLRKEFKKGRILLATHGETGQMIYAAYYGLGWKEVLQMFHFDNANLLVLSENSPANEPFMFPV